MMGTTLHPISSLNLEKVELVNENNTSYYSVIDYMTNIIKNDTFHSRHDSEM